VQGDAGKLRQVLINLLGNAVKFTETGDVWLRARSQPVADDPDRVMLQLEAQDTGPGIPQDRLDEIFDSFVQLDHVQSTQGGTGLGLAISKTLVDMMGGEITVESQAGQGSLFTVNIPFQLAEAGAKIPGEAPVAEVTGLTSGQSDWRILVVDDNKENRLLLSDLLSRVGFEIKEAKDGEETIAIFQQWHPHFIWMDMRMPVMDGYAATRKIRELPGGTEVKIVAVTASVLAEHHEPMLAVGCDEVVRKPFREHEIFDAMARHLGVQYLYRERGRETGRDQDINLTPEMLGELPGDLLQELRRATLVLDWEAALEVIERIKVHAPQTAESLQNMVEGLQMGKLGELLKEV
jgi:CheY-like chemotaxis protein